MYSYWSILHTNELPVRHLVTDIDGPTSWDKGFMGPVCSFLPKLDGVTYSSFMALPEEKS